MKKRRVIIRRRIGRAGAARKPARILMDDDILSRFNPSLLGLGEINVPSKEVEAIAAVFDLSGFTRFCNQVDPHLAVPDFLNQFLAWLFDKIRNGLTTTSESNRKVLWAEPPFLSKFLGDGVMFLWNTKDLDERRICDIVSTLYEICYSYKNQFCPWLKKSLVNPPDALRCGLARGKVFSVGNGGDYIGHCINLAARLQKLSLLTFCFPRRGFDVLNYMRGELRDKVVQKRVTIKGILESDLVWVLKDEFSTIPSKEKGLFEEP